MQYQIDGSRNDYVEKSKESRYCYKNREKISFLFSVLERTKHWEEKQMKALVKTARGAGNVEVCNVPEPELINEHSVIIKVKACSVCGTDVHVWQDKFMYWPPVTLGHEFSGEIVKTGSKCQNFKVGDRIVAEPQINNCGGCEFCRSGREHMCTKKLTLGWRVNGGMAEYVSIQERFLHRIPDALSFKLAALCEPLAVAVYSIAERGKIKMNDFVVVQGSGPIGILSAFMAKQLGARYVLLTGIDASEQVRFGVAKQLGADYVLNIQRENLKEKVMELTGGKGADVVIETSGANSAISGAVSLLKRNGSIIGIGIPANDTTPFPWKDAVLNSLDISFSMSTSYTSWDKALGLLTQHGDVLQNIITWSGGIEDWERVFNSLVSETDVKAVFTF